MTVTRDDEVLGGEPRIDGTRVGVRHVAARVVDEGRSSAYTADQFDLTLAEVYDALSYYYDHVDEIREFERANTDGFERVRETSLKPEEPVE